MGTHRSVSRRAGDVVERSFFLREVALSNAVDDSAKGCHIWGVPTGSIRVAYMNRLRKHMCFVYQVSPVGCTSFQIAVTLRYE
jgi:hypothetical protein